MNPRLKAAAGCLASALLLLPLLLPPAGGAQNREAVTRQAWTLDEALAALTLQPRDAYLQYVVLQLARRAGRFEEFEPRVSRLVLTDADFRAERRGNTDLLSLFNGALAVQESLQLDAMRSVTPTRTPAPTGSADTPDARNNDANPSPAGRQKVTRATRARAGTRAPRAGGNTASTKQELHTLAPMPEPAQEPRPRDTRPVPVSALAGPTIKSHPWEKMLNGRRPELDALARAVPEDFYFAEFRTLTKLLDAFEAGDLWGSHLSNQALRDTATLDVGARVQSQLALKADPQARPFYDLVVDEVAVTGSDPFVREGSDVTLLFRVKQPLAFHIRMDSFIEEAAQTHPDAKRETGTYLGVEYVQLQTPERDLSVVSAYPEEGLHVRSNSLAAFKRVVEAFKGKDAQGRPARRLGDTAEFAYIRTLMPRNDAAREDGFVYLSDTFVRRLMGPVVKLTERRRLLCYNHLRMIGHAALLFRTERGRAPRSLEELKDSGAAPGLFGEGTLSCPDGGRYTLSADGATGACTHHGHALRLTPNIEAPVSQVSNDEADEYRAFVAEYNQYWRTYFDPIAFRLKVAPEELRVETIVLPLIDNTIYTGLASALGGAPEPLDSLPVPRRNIFSAALRLNRERYLKELRDELTRGTNASDDFLGFPFDFPGGAEAPAKTYGLLSEGIGNQLALHVYDSRPPFDLNVPSLLGAALAGGASVRGGGGFAAGIEPVLALGLLSLNAPVYASLPVADEKVVDEYLDWADAAFAQAARKERRGRRFEFEFDFYKYKLSTGQTARAFGLRFDPARLNFYWARIGRGLYVATKPFILEDLAALDARGQAAAPTANEDLNGHALAHVRAGNWNEVLPDYNLAWAENEREACLNNLGTLSDIARALTANSPGTSPPAGETLDRATNELAERLAGARLSCPDGGAYRVSPDGRSVECSVHGTAAAPRQPAAPSERSPADRTVRRLNDLTATLTFKDDGLHAVLVIKRK